MAQSPAEIAARWKSGLSAAGARMTSGVQSVSVAPGQVAARNKAGYVQGVMDSQDKWATNVARVSLSEWQQAMITKGVPRLATGAAAAESDFADFMTKLLPFQQSLVNTLPARGGLEQNIARSAAYIRGMAGFSR